MRLSKYLSITAVMPFSVIFVNTNVFSADEQKIPRDLGISAATSVTSRLTREQIQQEARNRSAVYLSCMNLELPSLQANTSLTKLDLSSNNVGDAVAQFLSGLPLSTLDLEQNGIRDSGAQSISANKTLTTLDAYGNQIGARGRAALAQRTRL